MQTFKIDFFQQYAFCVLPHQVDYLFVLIVEQYSLVMAHHILFIYSAVEGHLSCFQFLAIMNKTTVNIYMQVFMWTYVFQLI
jgi:hypothetical protein